MADYNINAVTRRVVFTGSAGLGPYAFTFEVLNSDDVAVYFNATLLTITTDYTVTINANGTGSVTIVTGGSVPSTPTASDQIVIVGARDIERVTDFVTAGDLLASSLNEQLDALTIFDQQVAEENKRAMRAPVYDPALVEDGGVVDMTLPTKTSRAGKTLAFDSNGNPIVGEDIGNWRGDWAASTAYTVRDLVKDPVNESIYRVNTSHTSSGSAPISTNADAAKFDLVIDATAVADAEAAQAAAEAAQAAAETAETNAATSASSASTSASSASTSAATATTKADEASTSAAAAAASETASAASETASAASEAAAAASETAAASVPALPRHLPRLRRQRPARHRHLPLLPPQAHPRLRQMPVRRRQKPPRRLHLRPMRQRQLRQQRLRVTLSNSSTLAHRHRTQQWMETATR